MQTTTDAAMVRDVYLRLLFIPLLGIFIPVVAGIVTYENYSTPILILANLYFILISFIIWRGCNWIHQELRPMFGHNQNPFIKIFSISSVSALYGAATGGSLTLIWFRYSKEQFTWNKLAAFLAFCCMAVVIFTLVYEILFLTKERELDNKIVDELDRERMEAELTALQNELDPHFMFNSLNTLNHLIVTQPDLAYLFNVRLAQVYKYFLANKHRELVSLDNEMEFIRNYFFLQEVRYENKLKLENKIDKNLERKILVPPCALQILMENAVKHNEFTTEEPLKIKISINGEYLKVSNNLKPKAYLVDSTYIGLKNLSARYKLVCKRDIVIENNKTDFLVKLPLISNH